MADAWQVLSSCFVLIQDNILINEKLHSLRTEKDVERLKKAENGKKGGLAKAIGKQVLSNCHIEDKRKEDKKREDNATPEGVSPSIFKDYLKVRKAKKSPWTPTALEGLQREAKKAGKSLEEVMRICCEKNWVGFNPEWLKTDIKTQDKPTIQWHQTLGGVMAKGKELGIEPKTGETEGQYRQRLISAGA
jgi:hypothetical protein